MWSWNRFIRPPVAIEDPTRQVVPVSTATCRTVANSPLRGERFAGAWMATVPMLIRFFLLHRDDVRGMLLSGMP